MATLQRIRNKAGVLVAVVIGLALFAFILGDMLGSGNSVFSKQSVAEINGKAIGITEYLDHQTRLREFYQLIMVARVWIPRLKSRFSKRHGHV